MNPEQSIENTLDYRKRCRNAAIASAIKKAQRELETEHDGTRATSITLYGLDDTRIEPILSVIRSDGWIVDKIKHNCSFGVLYFRVNSPQSIEWQAQQRARPFWVKFTEFFGP